jgi:hypothetical protein
MAGPALAVAGFLCVLAILAYALLRHVYLAALTVAAPLCVMVVFLALPQAWKSGIVVLGLFIAPICVLFVNDRASRSICMGVPPRDAVISALREIAAAILPIAAAYLGALLVLVPGPSDARAANAVTIAVVFAVSLALGAAAMWFNYPEDFVGRANAARERRERLFERPVGLSETRWSLSVSGIALVLAAVALFGLRSLHAEMDWRAGTGFAGSTALLAAAFVAITRNWRLTLAATLAIVFVALLVLWMYARIDPSSVGHFDLWLAMVPGLVAMSVLVQQMSRRINQGEDPASAVAFTLREQGPATTMAFAVLALIALIFSVLFKKFWLVDFMPAIAGLAAALLFFPAFGNTLYSVLPRYRSVDEVFGKK